MGNGEANRSGTSRHHSLQKVSHAVANLDSARFFVIITQLFNFLTRKCKKGVKELDYIIIASVHDVWWRGIPSMVEEFAMHSTVHIIAF